MYIEWVPNRNSRPTILLREAWREGTRIRKRTIANLSHWPDDKINSLRLLLKGEPMIPAGKAMVVERSLPWGHILAILIAILRMKLDTVIALKPSRNRSLVIALVVEALLCRHLPSQACLLWHASPLAAELRIEDACAEDFSRSIGWLESKRQGIEMRLYGERAHEPGKARERRILSGEDGGAFSQDIRRRGDVQGDFRAVSYDSGGQGGRRERFPLACEGSTLRKAGLEREGTAGIFQPPGPAVQHLHNEPLHPRVEVSRPASATVSTGAGEPWPCRVPGVHEDFADELAAYAASRMMQALAPLLTPDGAPFTPRLNLNGPMPFTALLALLSTQCLTWCRIPSIPQSPPFTVLTMPTELQARAFTLLEERLRP